jgi:hypothetical protein
MRELGFCLPTLCRIRQPPSLNPLCSRPLSNASARSRLLPNPTRRVCLHVRRHQRCRHRSALTPTTTSTTYAVLAQLDTRSRLFKYTLDLTTAYAPPTSYLCPPSPRVADSPRQRPILRSRRNAAPSHVRPLQQHLPSSPSHAPPICTRWSRHPQDNVKKQLIPHHCTMVAMPLST